MSRRNVLAASGGLLVAGFLVVAGCAPSPGIRYYDPVAQPTVDKLERGMPVSKVRLLLGVPHEIFEVKGGGAVGKPWSGIAYVYKMDADPRFGYFQRRLENRLVFEVAAADTLLNYWEIEQGGDRYFKAPRGNLERREAGDL